MTFGKWNIVRGDLVEFEGDALVFSSNEHLFLSGGVGGSLLGKFGDEAQRLMSETLQASGKKLADYGDLFEIESDVFPWKKLVPVIATNGWYETEVEKTREILEKVLARLSEGSEIKRVGMSVLGAGYGDMEIETFIDLALMTEVPESIQSVEIVIHSEELFRYACRAVELIERREGKC